MAFVLLDHLPAWPEPLRDFIPRYSARADTRRLLPPDEAEQPHRRARRRDLGGTLDVGVAARVRNAVKTSEIQQQAEAGSDAELHEAGDVAHHQPRRNAGGGGLSLRSLDGARHEVDAGCLPTVLSEVDGVGARPAAEVERL